MVMSGTCHRRDHIRRGEHRVHAGRASALPSQSMLRMRPCATELRRIAACSVPFGAHVVDVLPAAAQEAQVFDAFDRAADETIAGLLVRLHARFYSSAKRRRVA